MPEGEEFPLLFEPLEVEGLRIRNRVVMPPMASNMGVTSEQARHWYGERAAGGVGLVIVEGTHNRRFQEGEFVGGLAQLSEAIKGQGAAAVIQLFQPPSLGPGRDVSVSGTNGARAITTGEIGAVIDSFGAAAHAAREAGFDGGEVHGAHGFFFNQFLSPRFNRREDRYGGDLEGRMRLGVETVRAMRNSVGKDFSLFYRHTPLEAEEGGYTLSDSLQFARRLQQAGLDVIDISPSTSPGGETPWDCAAAVKEAVEIPVIAVGGMDIPERAEEALRNRACDLVAVGRGLIADAHWADKVRKRRIEEIVECIQCNEMCYGNLSKGLSISCTQNPGSGFEYLRHTRTI